MGRKKKKPWKPWCWYCNREFDDEKILIKHQRSKHFKCHLCHRKVYTGPGLAIHCLQVHKDVLDKVPNALPNRNNIDIEIYGMIGIPDEDCSEHEIQKHGGPREKAPSKLLQKLSEDFGRFYESKVDTDFLLRVGEVLIPVHSSVLSARSEVFAAMFRHETLEKQSGVVDIPDVDAGVLSDVLYYVYSGQIRMMSADTICAMYVVADKYALIELRDASMDVLMCNLTVENVCDAAQLADTYGETQLEEKVVHFVKEKIKDIEETYKWKEFLKSQPTLGLKLLSTALKICKDEVNNVSPK